MDSDHSALLAAVETDHPCANTSCDICAMIGQRFGQIAAYMLCSATNEHPAVDAVMRSGTDTLPVYMHECDEWQDWLAFHYRYGIECPSCESFNYGNESSMPRSCDNCGAQIPRSEGAT